MPSEHRLVRPFVGVDDFASAFSRAHLRLGGALVENGERLSTSSSSLLHDPPVLVFAPGGSGEALRKSLVAAADVAGLEPEAIEVIVVASTPYLRLADVLFRMRISSEGELPDELDLRADCPDAQALKAPMGGCDVSVYVCLAEHRSPEPLKPTRKGTWLGRATFGIRTELGELGFTPVALTPASRAELKIGPDTSRFVQIDDAEDLLLERLDDAVTLHVDEDLLAAVSKNPNSPAARAFQRQLFLDVITAIIGRCAQWDGLGDRTIDDLEGSTLGAIVRAAAGTRTSDADDRDARDGAFGILRHDPERFLALLDDRIAPVEDLRLTLGGFAE